MQNDSRILTVSASDREPVGVTPANVSHVRVRMYHTDLAGGVFHGRYLDLFEEARTEAFRRAGFEWGMTHREGIAFLVTHIECDYFRAATMDEYLAISVFVSRMTHTRCIVEYEVRRAGETALVARGRTDFAFWDSRRNRPAAVPDSLRAAALHCEGMWRPASAHTPVKDR